MKNNKLAALAVVGAVVVSIAAMPATATADVGFGVATVTITPISGNVNTDPYFLNSIAVNSGGPVGFRTMSATYIFQDDVNMGAIAQARTAATPASFGTWGLDGNSSFAGRTLEPVNPYVSDKQLDELGLAPGRVELRYFWSASSTVPDFANDPYVRLFIAYDPSTGEWRVVPEKIDTVTSLTASAVTTSIALSAEVKNAISDDLDPLAVGTMIYTEGSVTVASVPVEGGRSYALLTNVPVGPHTYLAEFVPTDPEAFYGSVSNPATAVSGAISDLSNIIVAVPSGVGALTLTGSSSSVNLGTAVLGGGTLNAQGTVTSVVTDTRQLDYPAWSLTGIVGDFTSGANILNGKYLGWTPAVSGDATNSVAGPQVLPAPATTTGLKSSRVMASGAPFDGGTITNASALLQLKAPSNTRAGTYSTTLTLTLI